MILYYTIYIIFATSSSWHYYTIGTKCYYVDLLVTKGIATKVARSQN